MKKIIVVDSKESFPINLTSVGVVSVDEFLRDSARHGKQVRVFTLCDAYGYQTKGYYVSLLAEARGYRVIPDVRNLLDLQSPRMVRTVSEPLNDTINRCFARLTSKSFTLSVYFGLNFAHRYQQLARELFMLFGIPLFRVDFVKTRLGWSMKTLQALALKDVPEEHLTFVYRAAEEYFGKTRYRKGKARPPFNLAILVDPADEAPPSNSAAIALFEKMAPEVGFEPELIGKGDYERLLRFDALLIRRCTSVLNYSYRFARRAQNEGIPVFDSPEAILRCNNKVFMQELLENAKLPVPKTAIISSTADIEDVISRIGLPLVIKIPDSTFSFGVKKFESKEPLREFLIANLKRSELLIAQEYLYTSFDWRVGILDGEAIFVCQYEMAPDHWQILNWDAKDRDKREGGVHTFSVQEAPHEVVRVAIEATRLLGDGLYGVDLKQIGNKIIIIEVNENPNIDAGCEDFVIGEQLYYKILMALRTRIEKRIVLGGAR